MQFFISETTEILFLISYALLTLSSLILLSFDKINQTIEKIFWLFFIIFVPYLGSTLYLLRFFLSKKSSH
jgi:hypothetical protein